uniref:ARAD1D20900p n=1 Tax=Blastobotrys adeninivorans TaxID=409370 RepID=A0A060TF80_BLAAD
MIDNVDDDKCLANVGYAQELKRSFSLWSMIGFSFSILGCYSALAGSLSAVMTNGGPVALFWGWLAVGFFSMFAVVSMAEICSSFPVCGGQYSWVLLLTRGKKWSRAISYVTGCIQLGGLLCMGSTALYMLSQYIGGMVVLGSPDESFVTKDWQIVLYAWAVLLAVTVLNIFGQAIQKHVSSASLYWVLGTFFVSSIVVLAVNNNKRDAEFVFFEYIDASGWDNKGIVVILGIMQCAYGLCCYDAPAHMCEEMTHATRDAPRAMVLSVIIGFFTGLVYILVLLFDIVDIDKVSESPTGVPLLEIFYQATRSKPGALCLQVLLVVNQLFSSNALLLEGSRSVYAFARDGAFPKILNDRLKHVHESLDVPVWAVIVSAIMEAIFVAILFGSSAAFFTVLSVATTGLFISYLLAINVAMFNRSKLRTERVFDLGRFGIPCNIIASVYLIFICIFFFFPTYMPVTGSNMNYASAAMGIIAVLGIACWFLGGRKTYAHQFLTDIGADVSDSQDIEEVEEIRVTGKGD